MLNHRSSSGRAGQPQGPGSRCLLWLRTRWAEQSCVRSHWVLSMSVVRLQGMYVGEVPLPDRDICQCASTNCLTQQRTPSEDAHLGVLQGPSKEDISPLSCCFPDGCFYPCLNEES